jgi:1,4-dihydroxy-2-naphthoyl-CoA hydrolase
MNDTNTPPPMPAVLEPSNFDRHCGIELVEVDDSSVRAIVPVREELLQPTGVIHGGVYAAIAEGIASLGTNHAVHGRGQFAMGISNATNFVRPISSGSIHAVATRRHLGLTTSVWDVEMVDDKDHLCAISRVTLAVRSAPRACQQL